MRRKNLGKETKPRSTDGPVVSFLVMFPSQDSKALQILELDIRKRSKRSALSRPKGRQWAQSEWGKSFSFAYSFPTVFRQAPLFFKNNFNLFLTVLGLHYCSKQGLLSSCNSQLLNAVASLAAEHGLEDARASVGATPVLSSCGSWPLEHRLNSCGAWA